VKFVIVLQGVTDIAHPFLNNFPEQAVSTDQIIGGLKQLIARAHARRLKVFGATLLPSEGENLLLRGKRSKAQSGERMDPQRQGV
jgi:hypothetical protein